jgi:histidinol-phosphate aminotransferase
VSSLDPILRPPALRPATWTRQASSYSPPAQRGPITLKLDSNEGAAPAPWLREVTASLDAESLRRYPKPREFEGFLADQVGLEPSRVLVTAGGDEAIDRACRVALGPRRELILPVPTFEMFARYAAVVSATVTPVDWPDGPFPVEAVVERLSDRTSMVAVVSPNNPTGSVIDAPGLKRVSSAALACGALVLADFAYTEFADEDLTAFALLLPNVVVVRTFSKAWGLAGLRVGYALGPPDVIAMLRAAAGPYSVSGPSLAIARACMERGEGAMRESVARAKLEVAELRSLLASLGVAAPPSQGNFVFARVAQADSIRAALAQRAIAVRGFPGDPLLSDALRITVPCDAGAFGTLCSSLREVLTVPTQGPTS